MPTATAARLLGDRFTLGMGNGEVLDGHALSNRWPPADVRAEMLEEAIGLIRHLGEGDSVNHRGRYFTVEDARIAGNFCRGCTSICVAPTPAGFLTAPPSCSLWPGYSAGRRVHARLDTPVPGRA